MNVADYRPNQRINPFECELPATATDSLTADCNGEIFIIDIGPSFMKLKDAVQRAKMNDSIS